MFTKALHASTFENHMYGIGTKRFREVYKSQGEHY
jgi:hypothetical protein